MLSRHVVATALILEDARQGLTVYRLLHHRQPEQIDEANLRRRIRVANQLPALIDQPDRFVAQHARDTQDTYQIVGRDLADDHAVVDRDRQANGDVAGEHRQVTVTPDRPPFLPDGLV